MSGIIESGRPGQAGQVGGLDPRHQHLQGYVAPASHHVGTTTRYVPQFATDTSGFGLYETDWVTLRAPRDYEDPDEARDWADEHAPMGHQTRVVEVTTTVRVQPFEGRR